MNVYKNRVQSCTSIVGGKHIEHSGNTWRYSRVSNRGITYKSSRRPLKRSSINGSRTTPNGNAVSKANQGIVTCLGRYGLVYKYSYRIVIDASISGYNFYGIDNRIGKSSGRIGDVGVGESCARRPCIGYSTRSAQLNVVPRTNPCIHSSICYWKWVHKDIDCV